MTMRTMMRTMCSDRNSSQENISLYCRNRTRLGR